MGGLFFAPSFHGGLYIHVQYRIPKQHPFAIIYSHIHTTLRIFIPANHMSNPAL